MDCTQTSQTQDKDISLEHCYRSCIKHERHKARWRLFALGVINEEENRLMHERIEEMED